MRGRPVDRTLAAKRGGAVIRYGGCISGQEEIDAVTAVVRSGNWACGEVTQEFETAAAERQGRSHALFVNSGS